MRKLFPYLLSFATVIAVVAYFLYSEPGFTLRANDDSVEEDVLEPDVPRAFTGRVVMPDAENILVLENGAARDIEKLALYFSGRSAGLHWLARPYFRNHHVKEDVIVGVNLTIDSLGRFACNEIEYTNAEGDAFKQSLREHIEYYWRYRRSEAGKTDLWLPIRFRAVY